MKNGTNNRWCAVRFLSFPQRILKRNEYYNRIEELLQAPFGFLLLSSYFLFWYILHTSCIFSRIRTPPWWWIGRPFGSSTPLRVESDWAKSFYWEGRVFSWTTNSRVLLVLLGRVVERGESSGRKKFTYVAHIPSLQLVHKIVRGHTERDTQSFSFLFHTCIIKITKIAEMMARAIRSCSHSDVTVHVT